MLPTDGLNRLCTDVPKDLSRSDRHLRVSLIDLSALCYLILLMSAGLLATAFDGRLA